MKFPDRKRVKKSFKIKFLVERTLKIYFQLEIFIMHGFWKQKVDFLTLDKIFVLDNLDISLDKKFFVLDKTKIILIFALSICPDKIFLAWTILKLSWTKILSTVKNSTFCFQKLSKMNFLIERAFKIVFKCIHSYWMSFKSKKLTF